MDTLRWIVVIALSLILVEGFTLSVFPVQLQTLLAEADPRFLQLVGLIETVLAAGLLVAVLAG